MNIQCGIGATGTVNQSFRYYSDYNISIKIDSPLTMVSCIELKFDKTIFT